MTSLEQLAERLDTIVNPKATVLEDTMNKKYFYREFDDKEQRRYWIDTPQVVAYWRQHSPARLYDVERLAEKYEKTLAKAKSKIESGRLEGRIIEEVYIPEGKPNLTFTNTDGEVVSRYFALPLLYVPMKIADAVRASAEKNGSPKAYAFSEKIERAWGVCSVAAYWLTLPLVMAVAIAVKPKRSQSQKMYEKLQKYRHEIYELIPDKMVFGDRTEETIE
ncbi:hypothetical protein HYS49_00755 [Candidatus Woesearchaeota archaeon]|nr:hypothetical protein [Candidatus Woesearchaeota archaeon]